jgi:hypothetical protein
MERPALRRIDDIINGKPFRRERFEKLGSGHTAEQLYVNQKVTDLVSKAEMEQTDYRESRHLNVFFGPIKEYLGIRAGILWVNSAILTLSTLSLFGILVLILRRQIRIEGPLIEVSPERADRAGRTEEPLRTGLSRPRRSSASSSSRSPRTQSIRLRPDNARASSTRFQQSSSVTTWEALEMDRQWARAARSSGNRPAWGKTSLR